MQWPLVVALVVAIPVILFPVAYIWYMNIGGIIAAIKEARERRVIGEKKARTKGELLPEEEYEMALSKALEEYPWR
jgi:hypothetical protein